MKKPSWAVRSRRPRLHDLGVVVAGAQSRGSDGGIIASSA